jgi:hypothetical protein
MIIYRQNDPAWSSALLGASPYSMGGYGCLTTIIANALALAGYNVTPLDVCAHADIYTDANYPAGAGLILWYKISNPYPQFHIHLDNSARYKFIQVIAQFPSGYRGEHWVLEYNGVIYDPLYGTVNAMMPANYRPTGLVRSADIDPAPVTVPVAFTITVDGPLGGANFRPEPKIGNQANFLGNGEVVECDGSKTTTSGQTLPIKFSDGHIVSSSTWYYSPQYGYVNSLLVKHN